MGIWDDNLIALNNVQAHPRGECLASVRVPELKLVRCVVFVRKNARIKMLSRRGHQWPSVMGKVTVERVSTTVRENRLENQTGRQSWNLRSLHVVRWQKL
jgi:hypothetical protein